MPDLFIAMFKEEWRVHAELFGSVGFALFPALVCAMECMGAVLVPIVNAALPAGDLATIVHLLGFDHHKLTYAFQGLDQKITGVKPAYVVEGLLA